MKINKFYNAEAAEIQTAAPEADAPVKDESTLSVAQLMAKQGVMNSSAEMVATPISIDRRAGETQTTKVETPVEPTTVETKVEETKNDAPTLTEKVEVKPEPQKEEAKPQAPVSWQDALKGQQPEAVLQQLGFNERQAKFISELKDVDEKVLNLLDSYKKGEYLEYLKLSSVDFEKMPAEELMRHQLRKDYPKASEAQLEALYEREIIEKYNLDSEDETLKEKGLLLLEAIADKHRDGFIQDKNNVLLPPYQEKQPEEVRETPEQLEAKRQVEEVVNSFKEDSYTKQVIQSGIISIGEGDEAFSFPVDGKELVDLVLNGDTTGELTYEKSQDASGKESYRAKSKHNMLVAAVNKYGEKFFSEYAKHFKSLGAKATLDPIENASNVKVPQTAQSENKPTTVAGLMAKQGVLNSGSQQ